MGQKINPIGFRLGITKEHASCWYADSRQYPTQLQEDHVIRQFIEKTLNNAGISDIKIARKADQIDLEVHTARPGVVVGRGGTGIESLRAGLQKQLKDNTRQIRINVIEIARVDAEAALIAEYIAQQLERREWTREGRVPLHTLRANIDYAYKTAQTTYGILGIKVWVFKGEIIPGQEDVPQPANNQPRRRQPRRRQQFEDRSNDS